jgi:hypothetical protein
VSSVISAKLALIIFGLVLGIMMPNIYSPNIFERKLCRDWVLATVGWNMKDVISALL